MKLIISVMVMIMVHAVSFGQDIPAEPVKRGIVMDTNAYLLIIAVLLLFPIWIMSNTFILAAKHYYFKKIKSGPLKIFIPMGMILVNTSLLAGGEVHHSATMLFNHTMTTILLIVIGIELFLLSFLAQKTHGYIRKTELDLEHHVREQNILRWIREKWEYAAILIFIILFGCIYQYRYHMAREQEKAVALEEAQEEARLQALPDKINESNVALMTGADLEAGKIIFKTNCAICHKSDGGGLVGPNLCDDYWIHGGTLNDLFKTIKYGYAQKGMQSWKDKLTALQIAQVANFIHSLKGTHPADGKEKQGTLFVGPDFKKDSLSSN